MKKYQVQYKYNTKTFVDVFESLTVANLLSFFDSVSACEVIEIREYVYQNSQYKEDDDNYIHSVSVTLQDNNYKHTFKIPKLKKTVTDLQLQSFIKNHLKINNKLPETVKFTKNFK